ncbi:hypothetical protein [Streptomyces anandii]|nr:hypothetical protein [Streptomyces anandii]
MFSSLYWVFSGAMLLISCVSVGVIFAGVRKEMKHVGRNAE